MSLTSIDVCMSRIESAHEASPIAVFKVKSPKNDMVDTVFANTVVAQRRIKQRDKALIGVFNRTMSKKEVSNLINKSLRPDG